MPQFWAYDTNRLDWHHNLVRNIIPPHLPLDYLHWHYPLCVRYTIPWSTYVEMLPFQWIWITFATPRDHKLAVVSCTLATRDRSLLSHIQDEHHDLNILVNMLLTNNMWLLMTFLFISHDHIRYDLVYQNDKDIRFTSTDFPILTYGLVLVTISLNLILSLMPLLHFLYKQAISCGKWSNS